MSALRSQNQPKKPGLKTEEYPKQQSMKRRKVGKSGKRKTPLKCSLYFCKRGRENHDQSQRTKSTNGISNRWFQKARSLTQKEGKEIDTLNSENSKKKKQRKDTGDQRGNHANLSKAKNQSHHMPKTGGRKEANKTDMMK